MVEKVQGRVAAEFVLSEGNGSISRDNITILSGSGVVKPGTVLGKVSGGSAVSAVKASGANSGAGTLTLDVTNPVRGDAKAGVYTVRFTAALTNNGTFRVEDPDGDFIGEVVMGGGTGAFDEQLKFVVADVGADFIVGDGFDITVSTVSAKYKPSPDALQPDGSHLACALNLYEVDATSADQKVSAITRQAEVNKNLLTYASTVDDATKKGKKQAQLAAVGIVAR